MKNSVALGARLLDLFYPEWWTFINTSQFDISDVEICVLGQLYEGMGNWSGYNYFTDFYNRDANWTKKYGFNVSYYDDDINHVNALWLNEIYDRVS